jgi:NTE family protein
MRTVRTFQQSTNVLVFRDPRTIGQQAANWHPRWVIRDNHAGLGSGPDPASRAGIGLALGGGFARGFAHLGVLQVLEQNHIPIACIAGTSVGSILGAAYASGAPLARIIATCRTLKFRDIGSWRVSRLGLASNHRLADLIARVFDSKQFEDLQIPMAVVATDLNTGEPVVLTHGNLVDAIRASCAFPGLFEPVKIGTRCLADGGLVAPVPTRAARQLGAEFVLGVSVGIQDGDRGTPSNIFQVVARAVSAAQKHQLEVWERHADLVIRPDVQSFAWDAFDRADEAIEAGAAITRRALPRIRKYLDRVLAASVYADNRSASLAAPALGHAEPGGDDLGAGSQSALVVAEIAR